MKSLKLITWMIVVALLLASCTNGDTNPTDSTTQTPTSPSANSSGYPAQGQPTPIVPIVADSSYPAPNVSQPQATLAPTPLTLRPPASGKANVHGILTSGTDKKPDVADLLLAKAVAADKPGFAPMLSFSDESSPRAVQDQTGAFIFFDVAPGQYGLVISSAIGGAVITDPSTNPPSPLIITVAAGDEKDLGTLNTP
jgi:hypothetical protein